jgi:hypothetical protein
MYGASRCVYLPLGELPDRTGRQLDERRATTGRWEPDPELVKAIRAYMPQIALTEDARPDPSGWTATTVRATSSASRVLPHSPAR